MPIRLRKLAISSLPSSETSWPNRLTSPRVGRIEPNSNRSSEVLPAPDGPVRNWKEWAGIRNERSRRISGPSPYRNPTFSNRTNLTSLRRGPWPGTRDTQEPENGHLENLGHAARQPGGESGKTVLRRLWFPIR